MPESKDCIGRAHKIATELESEGRTATDAGLILAMALGIFVEGLEGGHREMRPLLDAHLNVAQQTFDALRASRTHEPGTA